MSCATLLKGMCANHMAIIASACLSFLCGDGCQLNVHKRPQNCSPAILATACAPQSCPPCTPSRIFQRPDCCSSCPAGQQAEGSLACMHAPAAARPDHPLLSSRHLVQFPTLQGSPCALLHLLHHPSTRLQSHSQPCSIRASKPLLLVLHPAPRRCQPSRRCRPWS